MKPIILVVDDDPQNRNMLRIMLGLRGYEVEEAVDGIDALNKLSNQIPRLYDS